MIYFLCFILFVAITYGKARGSAGAISLALIDIALIFAILIVGGYIKL